MKKRKEFSPRPYGNGLQQKYKIRCDKSYTLWLYIPDTGLWSNNAEKLIEQTLRETLPREHLSNYHVREIISHVKSETLRNEEFPSPEWYMIPFNNGVYDIKEKVFREFMPADNLTSKLNVRYDPDNQGCPFIDKVFQDFVIPEDLTELYELVAYCMVPTYANQEVFFLLGSGRNGKSIYTHILTRMIGQQNVSATSLHDFQSHRFSGAELHGKFANISSELRYGDLKNTDHIKKLSGGDVIQAERKYQSPFRFENFAKLIFVTNELPRTMDKTNAFYRRIRIIKFSNSFDGANEDKLLKNKITTDELEGLAFKCIQILHDMIKRNFTFKNQKATEDVAKEYEKISNPIDTFIQQRCDIHADGFIAKTDFKDKLDTWLRGTGHRVWMEREIAQYMKDKGIDDKKRTFDDGVRKNSWAGIKWKD